MVYAMVNTEDVMITRKMYLDGIATHEEYYADILASAGIAFDTHRITRRILVEIRDNYTPVYGSHLSAKDLANSVGLTECDMWSQSPWVKNALAKAFKERGDGFSLAGGCCAYKEALRQLIVKTRGW